MRRVQARVTPAGPSPLQPFGAVWDVDGTSGGGDELWTKFSSIVDFGPSVGWVPHLRWRLVEVRYWYRWQASPDNMTAARWNSAQVGGDIVLELGGTPQEPIRLTPQNPARRLDSVMPVGWDGRIRIFWAKPGIVNPFSSTPAKWWFVLPDTALHIGVDLTIEEVDPNEPPEVAALRSLICS